jgi:hypothetical protein
MGLEEIIMKKLLICLFVGLVGCSGVDANGRTDVSEPVVCELSNDPAQMNPVKDPTTGKILTWVYQSTFSVPGKTKEQMVSFAFIQKNNEKVSGGIPGDGYSFTVDDNAVAVLPNCFIGQVGDNGPTPMGLGPVPGLTWEYIE